MSRLSRALAIVCALTMLAPAVARAQSAGYVQGIGGLTFGDRSDLLVGAGFGFNLTESIQAIGEGAYMRNTRPDLFGGLGDIALRLAGVDVRLSTLYGEGGVRFLTPYAPVRGYVETTAGVARLSLDIDFASNFGFEDPINRVLDRFNTTQPLLGLGGGVLLSAGPARVDLGYRFKRIYTDDPLDVNQVRAALGFSF